MLTEECVNASEATSWHTVVIHKILQQAWESSSIKTCVGMNLLFSQPSSEILGTLAAYYHFLSKWRVKLNQ